jgi:hypothetical protein
MPKRLNDSGEEKDGSQDETDGKSAQDDAMPNAGSTRFRNTGFELATFALARPVSWLTIPEVRADQPR